MSFLDHPFSFLTGAAGCGKTYAVQEAAKQDKSLLLVASTGIAAVNMGGCATINSTLGFFDTASLQDSFITGRLTTRLGRLWKAGVRRICLDEVSMTDADQITYFVRAIEELNGRGYVLDSTWADESTPPSMGFTITGDFCQLGPVKAPYAFESPEWHRFAEHTDTLMEIRRQVDPDFIHALRAARRGDGRTALEYFGSRLCEQIDDSFVGPTVFAKNEAVDRYNQIRFDRIHADIVYFPSSRWGKQRSEWGNPEKPTSTWGIPERLPLKIGSLVMILANVWSDGPPPKRAIYVNGDLGEVMDVNPDAKHVRVKLQRTSEIVSVEYCHREVTIPCDSSRRKELRAQGLTHQLGEGGKWEVIGAIDYLPLRLAWATTCHKAQGLSFQNVQINLRDAFWKTNGITYVGLSRARTPEGLRIVGSAAGFIERCTSDPKLKDYL